MVTAAGHPGYFIEVLRHSGVKVLHVVSSVRQARTSQSCGVDAVIAEGIEAGGHNGRDELPLFSMVPQVVDSVSIPVVAAGGIADARGGCRSHGSWGRGSAIGYPVRCSG